MFLSSRYALTELRQNTVHCINLRLSTPPRHPENDIISYVMAAYFK